MDDGAYDDKGILAEQLFQKVDIFGRIGGAEVFHIVQYHSSVFSIFFFQFSGYHFDGFLVEGVLFAYLFPVVLFYPAGICRRGVFLPVLLGWHVGICLCLRRLRRRLGGRDLGRHVYQEALGTQTACSGVFEDISIRLSRRFSLPADKKTASLFAGNGLSAAVIVSDGVVPEVYGRIVCQLRDAP